MFRSLNVRHVTFVTDHLADPRLYEGAVLRTVRVVEHNNLRHCYSLPNLSIHHVAHRQCAVCLNFLITFSSTDVQHIEHLQFFRLYWPTGSPWDLSDLLNTLNSNLYLNFCLTLWAGGLNVYYVRWHLTHKQQPRFHLAATFRRAKVGPEGDARLQVRLENSTWCVFSRRFCLDGWNFKLCILCFWLVCWATAPCKLVQVARTNQILYTRTERILWTVMFSPEI